MKNNTVNINIDYSAPEFVSGLELGVTYTQRCFDNFGHPVANKRGEALLRDACRLMNTHIQGWGTFFPEKEPGVWDWTTMDRRIEHIRKIGGTPVITLCAAPDWMKGEYDPQVEKQYSDHGQQWWWFEKSPLPEYFHEFARVCVEVAKRYPDVRHYQVWNEMKGFVYEDRDFQFDDHNHIYYREYTDFYNIVYTALKEYDPTLSVGGFYPVLQGTGTEKGGYYSSKPIASNDKEALLYWLEHKAGADFICVDRGMECFWDTNTYTDDEIIDTAAEFESIMHQLHGLCDLPIWWSEYYFAGRKGSAFLEACSAAQLYHMVRGGGETKALLWNPLDTENLNTAIFTSNADENGCRPTPYYRIYRTFNKAFGEGRPIYPVSVSAPNDVLCMASDKMTVIINKRNRNLTVCLNGREFDLTAHSVLFLPKM